MKRVEREQMKVIYSTFDSETQKLRLYNLTKGKARVTISDLDDGAEIDVADYVLYEDDGAVRKDGTPVSKQQVGVLAQDGSTYVSASPTVYTSIADFVEVMGEDANTGVTFVVRKTKSKGGRTYTSVDFK